MSAATTTAPSSRPARFAAWLPAVLHDLGDYSCRAVNLSRSGALLIGDLPVPSAAEAVVTLRSTAGDLAVKVATRIVRIVGGDAPGEVVIAVEFAAMDDRRAKTIEKLIARAKEHPAQAPPPRAGVESAVAIPGAEAAGPPARSPNVALAQRAQPEERARLFLENDPAVFEGLARNPRLSKREIKALADRSNLLPTTVALLAAHPRAAGDENLQGQLAAHPAAPLDLAKAIANGLGPAAVSRLLRAPSLADGLRNYLLHKFPAAGTKTW